MFNNTIYIPTNMNGLEFFKIRKTHPGRTLAGIQRDLSSDFDKMKFEKMVLDGDIVASEAKYVWKYSNFIVDVGEENKYLEGTEKNVDLSPFILINPLFSSVIPLSHIEREVVIGLEEISTIADACKVIQEVLRTFDLCCTSEAVFDFLSNLEIKRVVRYSLNDHIEYHTNFIDGYYFDYKKFPIPHHQIRPASFLQFYISITEDCNQICTYCYYAHNKRVKQPAMDIKTLHQTIWFIRDLALYENRKSITITWWGGDAACEPNLVIEGIKYADEVFKGTGIKVTYSITSSFANDQSDTLLKYIVDRGISINLSTDGYRSLHNDHRKLLDNSEVTSFDIMNKKRFVLLSQTLTFTEKYRMMVESGTNSRDKETIASRFKLRQNCNLKNEKELDYYDELCDYFDLFDVQYKINLATGNANINAKNKWEGKIVAFIRRCKEEMICNYLAGKPLLESKNVFLNMSSNPIDGLDFCYSKCGFGGGSLCINTKGEVYTCHRFCDNPNYKLGEITDLPAVILMRGNTFQSRWLLNYEPCKSCEKRSICSGGCAHEAYTYNNSVFSNAGCISLDILFEKAKLIYLLDILYPNYDYSILALQSNKNSRYEWFF